MPTVYTYAKDTAGLLRNLGSVNLEPTAVTLEGGSTATFSEALSAGNKANLDNVMADMGYVFVA
jgi:hypothetical protein